MTNRNRFPFALTLLIGAVFNIFSIPAIPTPIQVQQPDGTPLTLHLVGDETGFTMLTPAGEPIVFNPANGRYECLPSSDPVFIGRRTPTPLRNKVSQRIKTSDFPTTGKQKTLVILVEFADKAFTTVSDPHDYYTRLLNQEGFSWDNGAEGSARDFYLASSIGLFDPEFVVAGPVKLPHDAAYYGNDDPYLDMNAPEMVTDACMAAAGMVNFADFDADGDGYVDNIFFFYAGYGQADTGVASCIWPHAAKIEDDWGKELILNGKHINHYACSNEIRGGTSMPLGIGTFVHEFGHVLGLADHYDTKGTSGRVGVRQWDTMGTGAYLNNQNTPPLFNAFERAELGWLTYTDIHPKTEGWIFIPPLSDYNMAYRIMVEDTDGREYFILENRCKSGWDAYLPGEGMLVWHVDMDEAKWRDNIINTDPVHQHYDLIEADGYESESNYAGDPFPGRDNVTRFSFTSWAGDTHFGIDHIISQNNNIKVLLADTDFLPPSPRVSLVKTGGESILFAIAPNEDVQSYTVAVTDSHGNPAGNVPSMVIPSSEPVAVTGLSTFADYSLSVKTHMGSYVSRDTTLPFSTGDISFFELSPLFDMAEDVTPTSFVVRWEPMAEATDYLVSLRRRSLSEPVTEKCGFDEIPNGFFTDTYKTNPSLFGDDAPSLQFNENGTVGFRSDGSIQNISFWVRSSSSANSLSVETRGETGEEWKTAAQTTLKSGATTLSFDLDSPREIRLAIGRKSGFVLIDDLTINYTPEEWIPLPEYTDLSTSASCRFKFDNLEPATLYEATVAGLADGDLSRRASMRITTTEISSVESLSIPTPIVVERFDLTGSRVGAGFRGVAIERLSDGTCRKAFITK